MLKGATVGYSVLPGVCDVFPEVGGRAFLLSLPSSAESNPRFCTGKEPDISQKMTMYNGTKGWERWLKWRLCSTQWLTREEGVPMPISQKLWSQGLTLRTVTPGCRTWRSRMKNLHGVPTWELFSRSSKEGRSVLRALPWNLPEWGLNKKTTAMRARRSNACEKATILFKSLMWWASSALHVISHGKPYPSMRLWYSASSAAYPCFWHYASPGSTRSGLAFRIGRLYQKHST